MAMRAKDLKGKGPSFLPLLVVYHAVNDGMLACISALYPVLKTLEDLDFDLTYENIGIITSTGLAVTIIFQILAGKAGDVKDPQYMLAGGILLLGLTGLMLTWAHDFLTLFSLLLILRVGASFYHPIGIGWISKRFTGDDLDRSMGYQSALGDAGVLMAFLTTGLVAEFWGWRAPLIIWGISNIVSVFIGMALRYDTSTGGPKRTGRDRTGPEGRGPEPARHRANSEEPDTSSFTRLYRGFRFSLIPMAFVGAAYSITTNFGPLMVTDGLGRSPTVAGLVIALWIGAGVISATLYGRMTSRVGRVRLLMVSFLCIGVTCLVIGLFNGPQDLWLVTLMMAIFGFFLFITWPGLFAMISDATGKVSQGFTFSLIFAGQTIGGATLAYIAGRIAEVYGIGSPFLLLGGLLFIPVVTLMFYDDHKGHTEPRDGRPANRKG